MNAAYFPKRGETFWALRQEKHEACRWRKRNKGRQETSQRPLLGAPKPVNEVIEGR